jgi:uncharacterized NAD(P)/FAD-binding protein YdhS
MQPGSATIAIIGGGFSGTVLAANLLRLPPQGPTRILLIERRAHIGCGVAYSPSTYPYLLNVPAARMSATSYNSAHLTEFARRHLPGAGADTYLPRQLYGEYLQEFLQSAERAAPWNVQLDRIYGEATAVRPARTAGPVQVEVGEQQLLADQVVLASGDPPPAVRSYAVEVADLPAYVGNPYQGRLVEVSDRTLLLIGTGLTMVDIAVAAAANNPALRIIAVSRHGRLPATQQSRAHAPVLDAHLDVCGLLDCRSLRDILGGVRELAQRVQQQGGDWREAVTRVRECVPAWWQSLGVIERRRFLRHVRVYWETYRHRMPPEFSHRIDELRRSGQLEIRAGTVAALRAENHGISVSWRARGSREFGRVSVDRVIDCSGSDHRLKCTTDVLWRQLLDAGLVSPDPIGLGLCTGRDGALIDTAGRLSTQLFYLGPMLRAGSYEATAVGELRVRAEALAAVLADRKRTASPAETDLA